MQFRLAGNPLRLQSFLSLQLGLSLLAGPVFASPPAGSAPTVARPAAAKPAAPAPVKSTPAVAPRTSPDRVAPRRREAPPEESRPAPVRTAPVPAGSSSAPEYADAWPSEFRPAPPDLQLKPEDARKADALTAFAQGMVAEDNADQDTMLVNYRRALELDPGNAELAVKVAYELARRSDAPAGIQVLKDAIKAAPKEPLPYIYLAQLYAKYLKKPELALTFAEQALALAPDNLKSYLAVHELLAATGQTKKAEALLERAAKSENQTPGYWLEFGEFYQKLALKDDGSASPEELKRMNAIYEKAAALGKDDPTVLGKVADFYVLSKQVKEAIPYYLAALQLRPGDDDPPLNNLREKLARSFLFTGQRDEAIGILEQMVKDKPMRYETYELLGELYEQKGEVEMALQNYEHSLQLDASDPRNHLRFADLLITAKKFDRAVEILQTVQKKFPDHEVLDARFYFVFGMTAERAGQFERAAELLNQSIQLDPKSPEPYNYLGYMWVDRGERLEEAGTLIKKALEIEPENGSYLDTLGWLHFKKGDTELALKELLRAHETIQREEKKDSAEVLDHIAEAYARLGKTSEAMSYWQKALSVETEDKILIGKITDKIETTRQKLTSAPPAAASPAVEKQ